MVNVEVFTRDSDYPVEVKARNMWDCLGDHGFYGEMEKVQIFIPYENIRSVRVMKGAENG